MLPIGAALAIVVIVSLPLPLYVAIGEWLHPGIFFLFIAAILWGLGKVIDRANS